MRPIHARSISLTLVHQICTLCTQGDAAVHAFSAVHQAERVLQQDPAGLLAEAQSRLSASRQAADQQPEIREESTAARYVRSLFLLGAGGAIDGRTRSDSGDVVSPGSGCAPFALLFPPGSALAGTRVPKRARESAQAFVQQVISGEWDAYVPGFSSDMQDVSSDAFMEGFSEWVHGVLTNQQTDLCYQAGLYRYADILIKERLTGAELRGIQHKVEARRRSLRAEIEKRFAALQSSARWAQEWEGRVLERRSAAAAAPTTWWNRLHAVVESSLAATVEMVISSLRPWQEGGAEGLPGTARAAHVVALLDLDILRHEEELQILSRELLQYEKGVNYRLQLLRTALGRGSGGGDEGGCGVGGFDEGDVLAGNQPRLSDGERFVLQQHEQRLCALLQSYNTAVRVSGERSFVGAEGEADAFEAEAAAALTHAPAVLSDDDSDGEGGIF